MLNGMRVVALEEHYTDLELDRHLGSPIKGSVVKALRELGQPRLDAMDEAGVDVQIISHSPPGLQGIDAADAPRLARRVNDRLSVAVCENPERFAAFAALPTAAPEAAADELERTVKDLGFKGAMINGPTNGLFLDDTRFWPIFERAEAFDVPIYIHPAKMMASVREAYLGDYARTHPMFAAAAWGYTIETGTHALRLVLNGLFDAYPRLNIILGHLGESIPFLMERIDEALSRNTPMKNFREVFTSHFYVTTSGFFSTPALKCCIEELGIERILFSIDWPFVSNHSATDWFRQVPLNDIDKAKLLHGNASRVLRL